jgi:hypothetical protein
MQLPLIADVVRNPGGAATVGGSSLVLPGYPSSALLEFGVSDVNVKCMGPARLVVARVSGSAVPTAWVSLEDELMSLQDGSSLGGVVVAESSPSVLPVLEGATFTWDVSELLRWSRASQQSQSTFVVVLKPGFWYSESLELGAAEGGRGATLEIDPCPQAVHG